MEREDKHVGGGGGGNCRYSGEAFLCNGNIFLRFFP